MTSSVSVKPVLSLVVARWALTLSFLAGRSRMWFEIGLHWLLVWLFVSQAPPRCADCASATAHGPFLGECRCRRRSCTGSSARARRFSGALLAFARMDGATRLSSWTAVDKTKTVIFTRKATLDLGREWRADLADEPELFYAMISRPDVVAFGGGVPLFLSDRLAGAVPVSGATNPRSRPRGARCKPLSASRPGRVEDTAETRGMYGARRSHSRSLEGFEAGSAARSESRLGFRGSRAVERLTEAGAPW